MKPLADMLSNVDNLPRVPALDYLFDYVDDCVINELTSDPALSRKVENFRSWFLWRKVLRGYHGRKYKMPHFECQKTNINAVMPSKVRNSDAGYDIVLIEKVENYGNENISLYDTGLRLKPADGWYFDLVARSSLHKTGYMLANAIGIIDSEYRGNVMAVLYKFDKNAPDLELPLRGLQIIPRISEHHEIVEVTEFDETGRGERGFGSSGK